MFISSSLLANGSFCRSRRGSIDRPPGFRAKLARSAFGYQRGAAQIGHEHGGNGDRSVGLLIVLENGGKRSANRQTRAVDRVQESGLATTSGAG